MKSGKAQLFAISQNLHVYFTQKLSMCYSNTEIGGGFRLKAQLSMISQTPRIHKISQCNQFS
eukprot:7426833-Ditylum_brightwellii.AAC.1